MDLIASDFLAGSILSWAMPICLLVAVTIWYVVVVRRGSGDER
jgi:cytochrome c-type biogenesis protein CcmH/NrfF